MKKKRNFYEHAVKLQFGQRNRENPFQFDNEEGRADLYVDDAEEEDENDGVEMMNNCFKF